MPIANSIGVYNVGRDCQVVIVHPLAPGGRVDIPNVTGFDCKQMTVAVKSDRLDGVQNAAELPKGWTGTFDADRGSSGLDDLFAAIELAWYNGGTVPSGTIYQYIAETNGSTSTYQFTNVALKLEEAGSWRGDAIVKQRIGFEAFQRFRV